MQNKINIISWNVNGIRSIIRNGGLEKIKVLDPEIICLQEIRTDKEPKIELGKYHAEYNFADRKGYSGTAILLKQNPLKIIRDKDIDTVPYNREGRVIVAELESCFVVNIYAPVAKDNTLIKKCAWLNEVGEFAEQLNATKPVVICGDFNIAPSQIDVCVGGLADGHAGCTSYERAAIERVLLSGFVDVYRQKNPGGQAYTWWSYKGKAREYNLGWRIDLGLVSADIAKTANCRMLDVSGSDHCPILLEVKA